MELKYRFVVYIGILVAIVFGTLMIFKKRGTGTFKDGVKMANTYLLDQDDYYKKRKKQYTFFTYLMIFSLVVAMISVSVLAARPYERKKIVEDQYCRDIILCLDVSTSVDELNKKLMPELIDTVKQLDGERFGIIIFNTSPVLLTPLTDDYEYVIEILENIEKAMKSRLSSSWATWDDDWFFWEEYISGGTLVGNEERGSSLIGDGLASTINNFSGDEKDRTKLVIFATDNDPYGTEIVPLKTAAEICKDRGITVYGIGTKEMTAANMQAMKVAVELTGGEFFLEESSGTFKSIVDRIESHSENLVKGGTYFVDVDHPNVPFTALLISLISLFVSARFIRK